jgi:hypothetical protein
MPEQDEIYQSRAEAYERLIQREDCQHNLLPALRAIAPTDPTAIPARGRAAGPAKRAARSSVHPR